MAALPKEQIEACLASFPYIRWDRFIRDGMRITAYGWIDRATDAYKDFVTFEFDSKGRVMDFLTSSARYSQDIFDRLYGDDGVSEHTDCERIEDQFDIPNSIHLIRHGQEPVPRQ